MTRLLLVLLAVLWPAGPAAGQDGLLGRHRVGLAVGVVREAGRDAQASPLRYAGTFVPVRASYAFEGARVRHHAAASVGRVRQTSAITRGDDHVRVGLRVALRHAVGWRVLRRRAGRLQGFAGVGAVGAWRIEEHRYAGAAAESFVLGTVAAGPALALTWAPSAAGRLSARVVVPAGAFVLRTPYGGKGRLAFRVVPAGAYAGLWAGVAYHRALAAWLALRAGLEARYEHVDVSAPARTLHHALTLGLVLE